MTAAPALAHHSFAAEFDGAKRLSFQGVVTKVEWTNPHTYFYVDVKDDGGRVVNWAFETAGPNLLSRLGWKRFANPVVYVFQGQQTTRSGTNYRWLSPIWANRP